MRGSSPRMTHQLMTSPFLAFALKLPLALLVFLVIAYAGTTDRRIAGVLFTFPILNGVAIIASPEPTVVADAIYPLVIFNCVLFSAVISFPPMLPPVAGLSRNAKLFVRVAAWSIAWFAGAWLITDARASIPGAAVLFVGAAIAAIVIVLTFWTRSTATGTQRNRAARLSGHWSRFTSFWANRTGLARI